MAALHNITKSKKQKPSPMIEGMRIPMADMMTNIVTVATILDYLKKDCISRDDIDSDIEGTIHHLGNVMARVLETCSDIEYEIKSCFDC